MKTRYTVYAGFYQEFKEAGKMFCRRERAEREKGRKIPMINYVWNGAYQNTAAFAGILVAFLATCFAMHSLSGILPRDQGREFAHDGKLSAGKPRGAGFLFVIVFILSALLFGSISREMVIYLILIAAEMLTGFLDDCAKIPWGEYKKGILDLVIAVMAAVTYVNFNGSTIYIAVTGQSVLLPTPVFIMLAVILIWASVNVTNCSDGVDGLSGTVSIVTLMTFYIIDQIRGQGGSFSYLNLLFVICILGYLWYNATPSRLMMGDAGSRAMGFFISLVALKSGSPFLYLLAAFVLIVDGGLGLVKVSLLRFLKIKILKNTRTPLHDHVRKVKDWSNTQTVFRFAIIQIILSVIAVYLVHR